jgi:hypothetical protein
MKRYFCLLMVCIIPLFTYAQSDDEIRDSLRISPLHPEAFTVLTATRYPLDFLPEMVAAVEKNPQLLAGFTFFTADKDLWYPEQAEAHHLTQFIPGILDIFNHPPDSNSIKDTYTAISYRQHSAYILSFPGMPVEAADGFKKMLPHSTAVRGLINRNISVDTGILHSNVSNYDFVEEVFRDGHIDLLKPFLTPEGISCAYFENHHTSDIMIDSITPVRRIQVEDKWAVLLKYQVSPKSQWYYALVGAFSMNDPFSDFPPRMVRCANDTTSLIQKASAYYKFDYGFAPYIP